MKKFFTFVALIVFVLLSVVPIGSVSFAIANDTNSVNDLASIDFIPSTDSPNLSDAEYAEYYKSQNILPTTGEEYSSTMISDSAVLTYLNTMYSDCNWQTTYSSRFDLSNIYGRSPVNIHQETDYILEAAESIDYFSSLKQYIGCGPVAMMEVFNYYAETIGYTAFNEYAYNNVDDANTIEKNRSKIAVKVLENTFTTGYGAEGTATLPLSFLNGAKDVLELYNLDDVINVSGDTVSSTKSLSEKVNAVKSSINNGIQVVWWTGIGFGDFSNHYMNITGYKEWKGTDANGGEVSHLFWLVNCNWSSGNTYIIDTNIMKSTTMGFFYFAPKSTHVDLNHNVLGIADSYNSGEISKTLTVTNDTQITASYLRMAKAKHYKNNNSVLDGRYMVLSANRIDEGTAYCVVSFPSRIKRIDIDISWWRTRDRYNSDNGTLVLQVYNNDTGQWETVYNFIYTFMELSTSLETPSKYRFEINSNANSFRVYSSYELPVVQRNSGRVVLHDINVFI